MILECRYILNSNVKPIVLFTVITLMKNQIGTQRSSTMKDPIAIRIFRSLRSYVGDAALNYIFANPNNHTNVINAAASLIARIIKVYWSKDTRVRSVIECLSSFFKGQTFHVIAGLNIATEIVLQMNQYIPCIRFAFHFKLIS